MENKRNIQFLSFFLRSGEKKSNKRKLEHAEAKITKLQEQLDQLQSTVEHSCRLDPPVVIENIYIDKINVDKFDLNNNIGALGVKELGGMLNIGANYGTKDFFDNKKDKENKDNKLHQKKANTSKEKKPPKVNIKGKKDEKN